MTIAIMFAIFLAIGAWAGRKVHHSPGELLLAGRGMPLWVAVLTTTATWVDGGYLLGTVEKTQTGLAAGLQGGVCFGVSLILGGFLFAGRMRRLEFTTLIDPFESRFGRGWAAVLFLPAMFGELFWSAELLVAIGATCGTILNIDLTTAIVASAVVVTAYTVIGGMWSVAYTDVFQIALVPIGMLAAIPFALASVGGMNAAWGDYIAQMGARAAPFVPLASHDPAWPLASRVAWWELTVMLVLGGIPWNCYFQRVLSCRTVPQARWHSVLAGVLTIALTAPPVVLGIAAFSYEGWNDADRAILDERPTMALPMLLRETAPPLVAMLGLGAIVGAVTSSFSASILSAGSMFSWNVFHRLRGARDSTTTLRRVIRVSIVALGSAATVMALDAQSVAALWFFTADLVFVLLFPQLLCALFDPRANRAGSVVAFVISLVLRLGSGIPEFGLPAFIPYAELSSRVTGQDPGEWYDLATGQSVFPARVLAAVVGLIVLPLVSRVTAGWDAPRVLGRVET
ncbi:MAG TPA: sodium:solute symporter family protein [Pirellulales bacterium]|nr:sodium:solute symporter family protein [Pirellulales bacterium]